MLSDDDFNTNNYSQLDAIELKYYFEKIFMEVVYESDRGAIIYAAAYIDKTLEKAIECVAPEYLSKADLDTFNDLAFSNRIKIAYLLRVIDKKTFSSLNTLRQLRNELAHNITSFSLTSNKDSIRSIYQESLSSMTELADDGMNTILKDRLSKLCDPDTGEKLFTNQDEIEEYLTNNTEVLNTKSMYALKWELSYAVGFMGNSIISSSKKVSDTLSKLDAQ